MGMTTAPVTLAQRTTTRKLPSRRMVNLRRPDRRAGAGVALTGGATGGSGACLVSTTSLAGGGVAMELACGFAGGAFALPAVTMARGAAVEGAGALATRGRAVAAGALAGGL